MEDMDILEVEEVEEVGGMLDYININGFIH
jgi:hypothetical protein